MTKRSFVDGFTKNALVKMAQEHNRKAPPEKKISYGRMTVTQLAKVLGVGEKGSTTSSVEKPSSKAADTPKSPTSTKTPTPAAKTPKQFKSNAAVVGELKRLGFKDPEGVEKEIWDKVKLGLAAQGKTLSKEEKKALTERIVKVEAKRIRDEQKAAKSSTPEKSVVELSKKEGVSPENSAPKEKKHLAGDIEVKVKGNVDKLSGRKTTTPDELNAIGIRKKDGEDQELTDDEIKRINKVRNGYDSFNDFLKSDPKEHIGKKDLHLFAGERVDMTVASDGAVDFLVDGSFDARKVNTTQSKPTKELVQMAKNWEGFVNSKSGSRLLTNTPYDEGDENSRFESRAKTYEKFGFVPSKFYGENGIEHNVSDSGQVLDNRRPNQPLTREEILATPSGTDIYRLTKHKEVEDLLKNKLLQSSPEERKRFVESTSSDQIIDFLGVKLPKNWESRGNEDDDSVTLLAKSLKALELNLKNGSTGVTAKNLLSFLSPKVLSEISNNI